MRILSIIVLLIAIITISSISSVYAVERMVIRFLDPEPELVRNFVRDNYDIASYRPGEYLDLVVTEQQLQRFRERGYEPIVTQTEERLKNNLQLRTRTIDGYRTYNDVLAEIQDLAVEHPDIFRIYNLGDSWGMIYSNEGNNYYDIYQHDIWAVKVTADPDSLNDRPAVYYNGAHHAREPLSTEVTMDFLNLLLDNYETDDEIAFLIDNTEIWFIPLVNPDGHKVVLYEIDIWWRKNIRDNNDNGSFDTSNSWGYGTDGVDLNRNYAWEWLPENSFSHPTYQGPVPASEPETAAMQQLMSEHHFVAGISYHTYSELVLYPFGYAENVVAPDVAAMSDLAVTMANTIPRLDTAGYYTPMPSWQLYPARGTTEDYAYGEHGIFSYTLELGVEFIPSPPDIQQISDDNMEAALILLRRVHHSTLTGHVTDAITGEPVVAEVFIDGVDDTGVFREPYKSNEAFGRYYRMLLPGNYDVIFSAYGYLDSETYTVTITEDGQTYLNAALIPAGQGEVDGFVFDFFEETPVANAQVTLLDTSFEPSMTDEDGYFFFQDVSFGNYQIKISADGYGVHTETIVISEPENSFVFYLYPPYLVDIFDNLDNWITTGSWGLCSEYSYIGDFSLADSPGGDYQSDVMSFAQIEEPISLQGATNASLSFMTRYSLEAGYDYTYLQIYTTDGDWQTLATFNGISDWTLKEFSLNDYLGEVILIRFLFYSDSYIEEEGIYIDDFIVYISSPDLDVPAEPELITATMLYRNYPNPFNPETTISFAIAEQGDVSLDIYNIRGQRVRNLLNEKLQPGMYNIIWDGKNDARNDAGSGVYFYRLESNGISSVKKMLLLK